MAFVLCGLLLLLLPASIWIIVRGRQIAEARGGRWGPVSWVGVLGLLAAITAPVGLLAGIFGAFRAVSGADPSEKAQGLAEGMNMAMWVPVGAMAVALLAVLVGGRPRTTGGRLP